MGKFFYRYFPLIALLLCITLFGLWSIIWGLQKDEQEQKLALRLENLGVNEASAYQLRGFPSRYDYRFESAQLSLGEGELRLGRFEILTYPQNGDRMVVGFGDAVIWQNGDESIEISGDPLRASLGFDNDQTVTRITFESEDGQWATDEKSQSFQHLVIAYDESHTPRLAYRVTFTDGETGSGEAENFSALLQMFSETYLQ